MAREFGRTSRVADQIQRELAELLQREVQDPRLHGVTVSGVEVSRDLAVAKVFISSALEAHPPAELLAALASARGFLRSNLARRLRMRTVPELRFSYDDSLERGDRLASLIDRAVAADHPPDHREED